MGRLITEFVDGPAYRCRKCSRLLAQNNNSNLYSKEFRSKNGVAYLFKDVINVMQCDEQSRDMTTGTHIVRDIKCNSCLSCVGWRYVSAREQTQKYKEGMFILERKKIFKECKSSTSGMSSDGYLSE